MATVDTLIQQLSSNDYYERSTAARALGATGDPRRNPTIVAQGAIRSWGAFRGGHPSVRPRRSNYNPCFDI